MYLARETVNGQPHYFIRESYREGRSWASRDLFALGPAPSNWIHYPGGNSYFIDENVEEALIAKGLQPSQEELEEVFWPFLAQEVRNVIRRFHQERQRKKKFIRYSRDELTRMQEEVHVFDKRRLHYLRYGSADPRKIPYHPLRLYNRVLGKSRDEIEQTMEKMEMDLRPWDHKTYIFTIFFLQRLFTSPLAGSYPQAMDPDRMDEALLEEICRMQRDRALFADTAGSGTLHPCLVRYVIMYFDSEFQAPRRQGSFEEDFINSHRTHRGPQPRRSKISLDEACRILEIPPETLRVFSPKQLARHYRKKALECHPDRGGTHEQFIRLTRAYRDVLSRMPTGTRPC